mmetsp:Transcript_18865/g.52834  ORF Transcript_18865/g.52834 Transcript_18865/m.52834 type:complete len:229 (+) Transcript_18865:840-1526(+)
MLLTSHTPLVSASSTTYTSLSWASAVCGMTFVSLGEGLPRSSTDMVARGRGGLLKPAPGSSSCSPRLRQMRPVRAISMMPNLPMTFCMAMHLPGSPDTTSVSERSDTSTTRARKICASCSTSVRSGPGGARSFMIIISRSMRWLSVMSSTYRTLTSFWICFTRFTTVSGFPVTTMVKRALSTVRPTAKDSMLALRLAKTPATRLIIPDSSATNTEMMRFSSPSFRGLG